MSRKKKKQTIESGAEVQATESTESTESSEAVSTEPDYIEEQSADTTDNLIHLSDAARRFAKGFKEHWIPGILSHAQSKNLPLYSTEEECKHILRMWGAIVD